MPFLWRIYSWIFLDWVKYYDSYRTFWDPLYRNGNRYNITDVVSSVIEYHIKFMLRKVLSFAYLVDEPELNSSGMRGSWLPEMSSLLDGLLVITPEFWVIHGGQTISYRILKLKSSKRISSINKSYIYIYICMFINHFTQSVQIAYSLASGRSSESCLPL